MSLSSVVPVKLTGGSGRSASYAKSYTFLLWERKVSPAYVDYKMNVWLFYLKYQTWYYFIILWLFSEVRMSSLCVCYSSLEGKVRNKQKLATLKGKASQELSDSKTGGADIVSWYPWIKSTCNVQVQLTIMITSLAHSHRARPRSSWKVWSTGQNP